MFYFRSFFQLALQKHVNGHINNSENKDSTVRRSSDPPVPKKLRVNGKRLRYRRQPFSGKYNGSGYGYNKLTV